jgi:prophage endopeptidase
VSALERWLAGLIVAAALIGLGGLAVHVYGAHRYDAGHAAAISERASQDAVAVLNRARENVVAADAQAQTNSIITKAKNEELAPVRERIVTQRVYVGSAICDRPAARAQAEGAAGRDSTDPPGRLVRQDVERDLVALKLAVEEDLATGRACQAFIEKNGLVP